MKTKPQGLPSSQKRQPYLYDPNFYSTSGYKNLNLNQKNLAIVSGQSKNILANVQLNKNQGIHS